MKKELYTYRDFSETISRWWIILLIGVILGVLTSLYIVKPKYKAEATIHIPYIEYSSDSVRELALYKLRLNQIAIVMDSKAVDKAMDNLGQPDMKSKVSKNLNVLFNMNKGDIKLVYSSNNKEEALPTVLAVANAGIYYMKYYQPNTIFELNYNVNVTKNFTMSDRITCSIIGALIGFIIAFGFSLFIEVILEVRNKYF